MDFSIRLGNGQVLRGVINSPGKGMRAVVILVHGLAEHIQRYSNWAEMFNKAGVGFAGVDLPGHGRSDGRRGHIKNMKLVDDMLDIMTNECMNTFPGVPVFLYGHSMGGGFVLNFLVRNRSRVTGAVVTSPWLRLSFEPDRIKKMIASVMKIVLPVHAQSTGLDPAMLSHDPEVVAGYINDALVHGKITTSTFHTIVSAARETIENASRIKVPVLIMHGSDDKITSPVASREFAEKSPLAELKIWDGGFHELHNEPFKEEVFSYIIRWIEGLIEAGKQA